MSHVGFARVLFVIFFALVAGLLVAFRRLRGVVEEERVDAVLRDDMRDDMRDGIRDQMSRDRRTW